MTKKVIIGLIEKIKIETKGGKKKIFMAKIDTGATKSSMDLGLAKQLNVGPVVRSRLVKSAHGNSIRPVVRPTVEIAGKKIKRQFTLADRRHLKYPILIGVNVLKKGGFIVNPSKK